MVLVSSMIHSFLSCLSVVNIKYKKWRLKVWARNKLKDYVPDPGVLTASRRKEIIDFFKPYARPYIKFNQFYTEKTGRFYADYIPDDMYITAIDQYYNDWDKAVKLDDKCYYDRLFSYMGFKQPETLCYRINGLWLDRDYLPITSDNAYKIINDAGAAFFKKSVESEAGYGVYYFNKAGNIGNISSIAAKIGDNIIVQRPIKQSPVLAKINTSSVNTIRMLSMLNRDGSVKIYSSILRMGVNGSCVDNASSGGITCGIMSDGRLKDRAFTAKGVRFDRHPDSKICFDTVVIPNFGSICEMVRKAHPQLANFRLLSWDIALGQDNEPILLEINMRFGQLDFHQLNNGPVFGEDTIKILDEVFGKKTIK